MPLSETNKPQSQSIEDLIAQLDSPSTVMSPSVQSGSPGRKCLKGKRSSANSANFVRHNSNGTNSVPLLQKNIITSKKYTKNLKSLNNRGMPKKNGAGGKHTWGAPGCELADYYIDSKDPNYDSEEAPDVLVTDCPVTNEIDVEDFDREIKPIVLEFFQNGDTIEVIDQLKTYRLGHVKPHLVFYLVQMALENNNTSKELMSRLLRDLTYEILTESDYALGFDLMLKNLSEITLDNPDAAETTGVFIARAIADKVISRKYIDRFYDNQETLDGTMPDLSQPLVLKCMDSARVLVTMNNHLNHLSHIWGNKGGFLAVTELVDKIKEIIQELYDSRDVDEAIRCLKELNVPHFHHELVFEVCYYIFVLFIFRIFF